MVMRRFGLFIIILGVVLILLGFIYEGILAGIPYQDPTPELLQKYMHYVNIGQTFYKFAFPMLLAGLLIILIQKILKLLKKHR
ncbi:MAG: hypothetical protein N2645_12785 [Clostridia bacterium]|nr:hypothetical protein [Clostridia bacterium]